MLVSEKSQFQNSISIWSSQQYWLLVKFEISYILIGNKYHHVAANLQSESFHSLGPVFDMHFILLCFIHRCMPFTSNATKNWCASTQTCSIIQKRYFKFLVWAAQWTWITSRSTIMEVTHPLILMASFLVAQILITLVHTTEKGFLLRYVNKTVVILKKSFKGHVILQP